MSKHLMRAFLAALLVAAPVVALSACGGGGSSTGESDDDNNSGGDREGESSASEDSHQQGQDCLSSGCHDSRMESDKRFKYAGTSSGGVGSTVTIVENDGTTYTLTVDQTNNFYTLRGNPSGGYTATQTSTMVTKPTSGSCNASGCHDGATYPRVN
jgi:hypothetical protein